MYRRGIDQQLHSSLYNIARESCYLVDSNYMYMMFINISIKSIKYPDSRAIIYTIKTH